MSGSRRAKLRNESRESKRRHWRGMIMMIKPTYLFIFAESIIKIKSFQPLNLKRIILFLISKQKQEIE